MKLNQVRQQKQKITLNQACQQAVKQVLNEKTSVEAFKKYENKEIEKIPGIKKLEDKSGYGFQAYHLPDGLEFVAYYTDDDTWIEYHTLDGDEYIGYADENLMGNPNFHFGVCPYA